MCFLKFPEYESKLCSGSQGLIDISKVLEISLMKRIWSREENLCSIDTKFTLVAGRKTDSCH